LIDVLWKYRYKYR